MTVRQLLNSMSSAELTEWMAYAMVEPIGDARGDVQAAIIATTFGNAFSKSQLSPDDFIIDFWEAKPSGQRQHPNAAAFDKEYRRLMALD